MFPTTYLPAFIVVHLPDGSDRLLYERVEFASGSSGRKAGTAEMGKGSCQVRLNVRDGLISQELDADIPLEVFERSAVTVGMDGYTHFHGTVRSAVLTASDDKDAVLDFVLEDSFTAFGSSNPIDVGLRPQETTGNRINRILDVVGWGDTEAFRDVDFGVVRCAAITSSDSPGRVGTPLALLNQVAATEGGSALAVRHGRKAADRNYNRGQLVFAERKPTSEPSVNIDMVSQTVDEQTTLYPGAPLEIVPDQEEIWNQIRLITPSGEVETATDLESIRDHGERLLELNVLSEGDDAAALSRFLLQVYAQPRDAVQKVKLSPYDYAPAVCRRVYRLAVNDVVRLTYLQAGTNLVVDSIQQINRVSFKIMQGDNTKGGAICDITLDLEAPENISYWRYDVRGASTLGQTTIYAPDTNEDLGIDLGSPPGPYDWQSGQIVSAKLWNDQVAQKMLVINGSSEERDRTRESAERELRIDLDVPPIPADGIPPDAAAEAELQAILETQSYTARPVSVGNRTTPTHGALSVDSATLTVNVFDRRSGGFLTLAHVAPTELPGNFRLNNPTLGRLNYGNRLVKGKA